jgi:pyridoxine 4-dehydrogenase
VRRAAAVIASRAARPLGDLPVTRFGHGAMQLASPGVMGPPADHDGALAVLREAADLGITHIDTAGA